MKLLHENNSPFHVALSVGIILCPWNSPGKNSRVGCHSLLQGIFLTWGLNPGVLHWQVDSLPSELSGKPRKMIV